VQEAEENFEMNVLRFTIYYYAHQIEEDEICGACGTHWRDGKCI
jgi:hypothetical protein